MSVIENSTSVMPRNCNKKSSGNKTEKQLNWVKSLCYAMLFLLGDSYFHIVGH